MSRITLSLAEWRAVARELAGAHASAAGPGLLERVRALIEQAPDLWSGQMYALEIDEASAGAIRAAHASLTGRERGVAQRAATVAEAVQIIQDHQHRP